MAVCGAPKERIESTLTRQTCKSSRRCGAQNDAAEWDTLGVAGGRRRDNNRNDVVPAAGSRIIGTCSLAPPLAAVAGDRVVNRLGPSEKRLHSRLGVRAAATIQKM